MLCCISARRFESKSNHKTELVFALGLFSSSDSLEERKLVVAWSCCIIGNVAETLEATPATIAFSDESTRQALGLPIFVESRNSTYKLRRSICFHVINSVCYTMQIKYGNFERHDYARKSHAKPAIHS